VGGDEEAGKRKDKVNEAGSRIRECWALKGSYPRGEWLLKWSFSREREWDKS
jgi:hypothetical protein